MKSKILITAVLFLTSALALAGTTAHSGFLDIFRTDLQFTLVVDRTEGMKVGDPVSFEDPGGRRETIGRIAAIPDSGGGQPVVTIRIEARHKDRVRAGSRVIVDRPWTKDDAVRVYIITPAERAGSEPLRSGAVVQAQTPAAGRAEEVLGRVQAFMGDLVDRSRQFLERMRSQIDRGEVDRFMDQLKDTGRAVGRYTREQKERFTKEVLPELEQLMESARRRFEKLQDPHQKEELEREFKQLKEELEV